MTTAGATTSVATPVVKAAAATAADPAAAVATTIGTSGQVNSFPGAVVPFGEVQWSPDTPSRPPGGGYEYTDSSLLGFSLTHMSGPGCGAYGDVPFLPVSGPLPVQPGNTTTPFTHTGEVGTAGYYKVSSGSQAAPVTTELTATKRSGLARFTFPSSAPGQVLIKIGDSQAGADTAGATIVDAHTVQGYVTSGHFCGASNRYTLHWVAHFDQPFAASGTWTGDTVHGNSTQVQGRGTLAPLTAHPRPQVVAPTAANSTSAAARAHTAAAAQALAARARAAVSGPNAGVYLTFDTSKSTHVQAKVGVSFVSAAGAAANLSAEQTGYRFATVQAAANAAWNGMLSKIAVGGGTASAQRIFYTALYHSLLHPNLFDDVDGRYAGFDGDVHTSPAGHHQYANYSGWDIYRSQIQLIALLAPAETSDIVTSMLNDDRQGGTLPKWTQANGESYVMVGDPADPIIADAYAFGARDFDTAAALKAMVAQATQTNPARPGLNYLQSVGYLPHDGSYSCCNFYGPVSTLLEYNTADFSIGAFARALGKTATGQQFTSRAQDWQNVLDPAVSMMRSKNLDGSWVAGFNPGSSMDFVEGNSAQYTPMVPFNVAGLIDAAGGKTAYTAYLDKFFSQLNVGGDAPFAWAGNEPGLEIPWQYDWTGTPWRTQDVVRRIQQSLYTDAPAGEAGNDDLGAMSSWYVWSALGMYPEVPGTTDLALGSPVFPTAVMHLTGGHTLTINAPEAAADMPYVQDLAVNGASWTRNYLPSTLLTDGGTLDVTLGSTANTTRGTAAADAPPSYQQGQASALGYTDPGGLLVLTPGQAVSVRVGARNLLTHAQTVRWSATTTGGVLAAPTTGSLRLPAGGTGTGLLTVQAGTATGNGALRLAFTDAAGRRLPDVVLSVIVAKPGDLTPFFNNAGISADANPGAANFDGVGFSFSADALKAAGVSPGGTVTVGGIKVPWPDRQPGQQDNIVAGGQTIPLTAPAGANALAVVGSATNGPSTGTITLHYADGTTSTAPLTFDDWTLNAGSSKPAAGETVVAATSYRNSSSGNRDMIGTDVFGVTIALTGSAPLVSVTLPSSTSSGSIHIFGIAAGTAPQGPAPASPAPTAPVQAAPPRTGSDHSASGAPVR